jgi:hypothetical protein
MRITRTRLLLAALVVGVAVAVPSIAGLASAGNDHSLTAVTKSATGRFHNLAAAERAGYALFPDKNGIQCIDNQPVGGMGVHYVKGSLVGDTVLDPEQPEALVYAPNADGPAEAGGARVHRRPAGVGRRPFRAAVAVRAGLQPDPGRQPLRDPRLLLAPRVGVGAQLQRPPAALEPARALLIHSPRPGRSR